MLTSRKGGIKDVKIGDLVGIRCSKYLHGSEFNELIVRFNRYKKEAFESTWEEDMGKMSKQEFLVLAFVGAVVSPLIILLGRTTLDVALMDSGIILLITSFISLVYGIVVIKRGAWDK